MNKSADNRRLTREEMAMKLLLSLSASADAR